jgi:hypothetical protein
MIIKYAGVLRGKPFNMDEAADELLSWINNTYTEQPALDVSYCKIITGMPPRSFVIDTTEVAPDGEIPFGLEPDMANVAIVSRPKKRAPKSEFKASQKAEFIYPMAATLVAEHSIGWPEAIKAAEKCFSKFANHRKAALHDGVPTGDSDDEAAPPVLEIEPEPR